MKAAQASSLVLVIAMIFCLGAVPTKAAAPTLADQLNMTLSAVDWSSPTSFIVPHFGLIFADQDNYDAVLATIPDFKTLIQMKRIAELNGVNSSLLDQRVAEAMDSQQMNGHWPTVDSHGMQVYWKFLVFTYKYANELGLDTSKWSRDAAFQEYLNCWETDHDFLWFNATDGTPTDYLDRYYDENAEVLSIFLKFYQIGIPEALDYAKQMWTHLCTSHWSGNYFPYRGTSGQVECEAGAFAETIAELYVANNHSLPNFPDYILQDLNYNFISGGDWSAKLWSPGAYVVRHAESNPEKRLENTVTAWAAMHSYYAVMDDSMKSNFVKLLTGSPNAWQGLIDNSSLYSEGRFRKRENQNYTDAATCGGAMILFLNGIVPDSGSLAIPVIDEVYQDWYSMFPASHFRFDYESQTIRIPIWAGKLKFTFGTEIASYNFSDNGIYEVHFSSDWNNVTNAAKISSLSEQFTYLPPATDTPPLPPPPSPSPSPAPSPSFPYSFPSSLLSSPSDTKSPIIMVVSPKNKTYSDPDIALKFTLSESTSWTSYSIDGKANVKISGETTLPRLPDGVHSIVVYASDLAGNVGASDVIHFTVDTSPPSIALLSPQNQTYNPVQLPLNFALNETSSWIGYSLDGQKTVTITGNTSLTDLASGSHTITVYANYTYGNTATSETIHFSVAEPFPTAWTAALTTIIIAGSGVAFLLHFKKTKKATTKPKNDGAKLHNYKKRPLPR
jgi:hypothetical protein